MANNVFGNFTHKWELDLPWHMVELRDWFYMVNVGFIEPVIFLHVRVCGIRSLWEYRIEPNLQRSPTLREAAHPFAGAGDKPVCGCLQYEGNGPMCSYCGRPPRS